MVLKKWPNYNTKCSGIKSLIFTINSFMIFVWVPKLKKLRLYSNKYTAGMT